RVFDYIFCFCFQAEDGIRDPLVTGVQTCALPIFTLSGSIPSGFPCRRLASSRAASRLLAAVIACRSPVKWRFRSSIGTTWAYPQIGRASCRERGWIAEGAGTGKKERTGDEAMEGQ